MSPLSLQELYAPNSICFGCGPANVQGLRIRSFVRDAEVVATWQAASHHQAFPGMLNGGILGALLDCHSNWTAAWFIMHRDICRRGAGPSRLPPLGAVTRLPRRPRELRHCLANRREGEWAREAH